MRYQTVEDLPDTIKQIMPVEAQEIYVEAYKESWENYKEPMGGDMGRASVAHRNAMNVVKGEFVKEGEGAYYEEGEVPKDDEEDDNWIEKIEDILTPEDYTT